MANTLSLTPGLEDSLVRAVESGVPIETAALAAGIGMKTFYRWLEIARDGQRADGVDVTPATVERCGQFGQRIREAQARHEAALVARIDAASQQYNAKTGVQEWRAGAWLLNNHPRTRATYRQERQVDVNTTGVVKHEHSLVKSMDIDTLTLAFDTLNALPSADDDVLTK